MKIELARTLIAAAAVLSVMLATASCSDEERGGVLTPDVPTAPQGTGAAINCTATVRTGQITCGSEQAALARGEGVIVAQRSGGLWSGVGTHAASLDSVVMVGGQGTYVRLSSSNISYNGTVFQFDVSVKNLLLQKLGTTDGVNVHPDSIRVFFPRDPAVLTGTGEITVANSDGQDAFTGSNQDWFGYPVMLATNDSSAARTWQLNVPSTVQTFAFTVYVWAHVQYPTGWVEVSPASTVMDLGDPDHYRDTISAIVRDVVGRVQPGDVTWTSSDPDTATVTPEAAPGAALDSVAVVEAVDSGTTTIVASVPARGDGILHVTVVQPVNLSNSTVTTDSTVMEANGAHTDTVTVQLRDGRGNDMTYDAGVVTLFNSGSGVLGSVSYADNGKYTAELTAGGSSGTDVITAQLDGNDLGDDATVQYDAISPSADDDAYDGLGNVTISVASGTGSLLDGDSARAGSTLSTVGETVSTALGGSATIGTDGSFTYQPPAGVTNTSDSFEYIVEKSPGGARDTATVTMALTRMFWFVDDDGAGSAPGVGTQAHPFKSLAVAASTRAINDSIFLSSGNQADLVTLKNGQTVIGQGVTGDITATVNSLTVTLLDGLGGSGAPILQNALSLAQNNTLSGFDVTSSVMGITGTNFGALTASVIDLTATETALDLNTGTIAASFGTLRGDGIGVAHALRLVNIGGVLSSTSGAPSSLNGGTSAALSITGGALDLDYEGTINAANGGRAVDISGLAAGASLSFLGPVNSTGGTDQGIYVHDNANGTINFQAGGILLTGAGPGVELVNNTGARINFDAASGGAGLDITTTTGTGFSATNGGVLTVQGPGNSITTATGTALFIRLMTVGNGGANGVLFDEVITAGAANGILLARVGQAANSTGIDINGGSIAGATARGVDIDSTSADVSIGAAISTDGTDAVSGSGRSVEVTNSSNSTAAGSQIVFFGPIDENGIGINLDANDWALNPTLIGSVITFSGGLDIDVTTSTGFRASNGGYVQVTGSTNSINATSATALYFFPFTGIGPAHLTFHDISSGTASNSTATGIVLNGTGSSGGLRVTGTGTIPGSGGTIQHKTGAPSFSEGSGMWLAGMRDVQIANMNLHDFDNYAIRGINITDFTLAGSVIDGANGNAITEGSLIFDLFLGQAAITNSTIGGGYDHNLHIRNNDGNLDRLTVSGSTFNANSTAAGGSAISMINTSSNTGPLNVMNLTVVNSIFTAVRTHHIRLEVQRGTSDVVITGNTMTQAHPNPTGGGIDIQSRPTAAGKTLTFDISNNSINGATTSAINVLGWALSGAAEVGGRIENNTIGTAGAVLSGSSLSSGIQVIAAGTTTLTTLISGNDVRQYRDRGIFVEAQTSSALNAAVIGNLTANPGAAATAGMYANGSSAGNMNLALGGSGSAQNDFTLGHPGNTRDVGVNRGTTGTFNLSRGVSASAAILTIIGDNNPGVVAANTSVVAIDVVTNSAVALFATPRSVAEDGTTNIKYTFQRSGDYTSALTVDFTVGGTASFGSDYSQSGAATFGGGVGSVTFAAGSPVATVTLSPSADGALESDETIDITVISGAGYTVGVPSAVTAIIKNVTP